MPSIMLDVRICGGGVFIDLEELGGLILESWCVMNAMAGNSDRRLDTMELRATPRLMFMTIFQMTATTMG